MLSICENPQSNTEKLFHKIKNAFSKYEEIEKKKRKWKLCFHKGKLKSKPMNKYEIITYNIFHCDSPKAICSPTHYEEENNPPKQRRKMSDDNHKYIEFRTERDSFRTHLRRSIHRWISSPLDEKEYVEYEGDEEGEEYEVNEEGEEYFVETTSINIEEYVVEIVTFICILLSCFIYVRFYSSYVFDVQNNSNPEPMMTLEDLCVPKNMCSIKEIQCPKSTHQSINDNIPRFYIIKAVLILYLSVMNLHYLRKIAKVYT